MVGCISVGVGVVCMHSSVGLRTEMGEGGVGRRGEREGKCRSGGLVRLGEGEGVGEVGGVLCLRRLPEGNGVNGRAGGSGRLGGLVDSFGRVEDGLRSCGVACDGVSSEACESDEMGGEVGELAVLISGFV